MAYCWFPSWTGGASSWPVTVTVFGAFQSSDVKLTELEVAPPILPSAGTVEWKLTVTLPDGRVLRTTLKVAVSPVSLVTSRGGVAGRTVKPETSLSLLVNNTSVGRAAAL